MRKKTWLFAALAMVIVSVSGAIMWQCGVGKRLRGELTGLSDQTPQLMHLRAQNQELRASVLSPREVDKLRAERATVDRLRGEMAGLRNQIETLERRPAPAPPPAAARANPPFRPVDTWRDAGRATPAATIETALWAAAGGDIDVLSALCTLDAGPLNPAARAQAEELWSQLPEYTRTEYGSPERLIASLSVKDVPLGSAQLFDAVAQTPGQATMRVRLQTSEGRTRNITFTLYHTADGWKLVVPDDAVEKYARTLAAAHSADHR